MRFLEVLGDARGKPFCINVDQVIDFWGDIEDEDKCWIRFNCKEDEINPVLVQHSYEDVRNKLRRLK